MTTVVPRLIGRFGNCMCIYAAAKALAEQNGWQLECEPWIGQKVFQLDDPKPSREPDHIVDGYCQNQESLIYSRADCKRWFRFKQEAHDEFDSLSWPRIAIHLRRGDYKDLGYVVVSMDSYLRAANENGHMLDHAYYESIPKKSGWFTGELSWVPDFFGMTRAKVLYRANSSFSWWAGVLSDAEIYSPVIDGLEGGKEQDCEFVAGNWPKFASLPNITDLHLREV